MYSGLQQETGEMGQGHMGGSSIWNALVLGCLGLSGLGYTVGEAQNGDRVFFKWCNHLSETVLWLLLSTVYLCSPDSNLILQDINVLIWIPRSPGPRRWYWYYSGLLLFFPSSASFSFGYTAPRLLQPLCPLVEEHLESSQLRIIAKTLLSINLLMVCLSLESVCWLAHLFSPSSVWLGVRTHLTMKKNIYCFLMGPCCSLAFPLTDLGCTLGALLTL